MHPIRKAFIFTFVFGWVMLPAQENAPDRPVCTSTEETGDGACRFNPVNGVGAGARVILYDNAPGHGPSRTFLRNALERLQSQYGFELTMTQDVNDLSEANLSNAKVLIFSNNDGDRYLPSGAVRQRVEDFVRVRGWGVITIHAGCAFINDWNFLQDVCVQQYFHHNSPNTEADMFVEDRVAQGVAHGRANPHSAFMLRGLPDNVTLRDEWYTWRDAPRTTHQYDRQSENKIMLLGVDESTFSSTNPTYGEDHSLVWTHTIGKGIAIYNSTGHDDVYSQDGERRAYGDSLLWRQIRYAAKDWSAYVPLTLVCQDPNAVNYDAEFDPATELADNSVCDYSVAVGPGSFVSGRTIYLDEVSLKINQPGAYELTLRDLTGKVLLHRTGTGPEDLSPPQLEPGIYHLAVKSSGGTSAMRIILR